MNQWKLASLAVLIVLSGTSTSTIAAGKMNGNITAASTAWAPVLVALA